METLTSKTALEAANQAATDGEHSHAGYMAWVALRSAGLWTQALADEAVTDRTSLLRNANTLLAEAK